MAPLIRRLRGARDAPGALGRGSSATGRRDAGRQRLHLAVEGALARAPMPLTTRTTSTGPMRRRPGSCRWRRPARPGPRRRPAPTTAASCPPGSPPSTPSWARAGCRDPPRSRCAGTPRRARPRSRCGWRPRHRRPARSSPGSTSPAPSIPSRPSPAASARNGSWCSPPSTSRRPSRSRLRSSRPGRWTSSSSTCPTAGTRRSAACASGTGWAGSRRWPGARGRCSWSLEPNALGRALAAAVEEASGLRLELERAGWIRLGRDVVGQRSAVTVARNRYGPPGRRTDLEILYAEGGARDACLVREGLLAGPSPAGPSRIRATGPRIRRPPHPRRPPST